MHKLCRWTAVVVCCFSALGAAAQNLRMDRERMVSMLKVVAHDIDKNFYDAELKGLDWKALTAAAEERIKTANTAGDMLTAIFGLVEKLQDSHTKFIPPSRVNRARYGFEAKVFGEDVRVYQIKAKGAAAKAGLQVGDRIVSVNGYRAERNSFDLMMLVMRYLRPVPAMKIEYQRGEQTPQVITVQPKIQQGAMVMDLTKDENIWNMLEEYLSPELRDDISATLENDIGFIEVRDFETEEIGVVHKLEKVKAVVVDLRGNPGGYQDALLELAGHFEPQPITMGEVVTRKKTESLKIKPQRPNFSGPLVILVDSRSASAAEMFARHFQIRGRAVVVGDRSSGRVNSALYFSEEIGTDRLVPFGVQISVGRVVFPGGEELEKRGVTPDVVCVPAAADLSEHHDPCLKKALSLAREKAGFAPELPAKSTAQLDALLSNTVAERQKRLDKQPD